jgi:hypothetical protein
MNYVERDCTIEHEGKVFESGGAIVTGSHAIAYPHFEREYVGACGLLKDWHGNTIGTCHITASWRINSYMSNKMFQIAATIDDVRYTGRGCGSGMIWRGKRRYS